MTDPQPYDVQSIRSTQDRVSSGFRYFDKLVKERCIPGSSSDNDDLLSEGTTEDVIG